MRKIYNFAADPDEQYVEEIINKESRQAKVEVIMNKTHNAISIYHDESPNGRVKKLIKMYEENTS